MAAVHEGRGRGRGRLPEGEAPAAHVVAEGKKVIKELVARQTTTVASLEQQRAREQERQFRRAAAVLPLGSASAGTSSLRDFEESAARARRLEELAGAGLAPADVQLLLEHESGVGSESRLAEPERGARLERLLSIQERLADASADPTSSSKPGPSRHAQELGSSLRLRGELSPFVRLALDKAEPAAPPDGDAVPRFRDAAPHAPGHPARRLPALERGMFAHLDDAPPAPPAATSRKRRRLRQAADRPKSEVSDGLDGTGRAAEVPSGGEGGGGVGGGSLWDVREVRAAEPAPARPKIVVRDRPAHGPARPKQYTVRDGSIVELRGVDAEPTPAAAAVRAKAAGGVFVPTGQGALSRDELAAGRLDEDEIQRLPRFAGHREGAPSAVLYVKNLDGAATEDDLAAVFGSFQQAGGGSPSLTFRLCGGRMRGQAFVTFPSIQEAATALPLVNGYLLRGRPMIVQFGRAAGAAGAAGAGGTPAQQ